MTEAGITYELQLYEGQIFVSPPIATHTAPLIADEVTDQGYNITNMCNDYSDDENATVYTLRGRSKKAPKYVVDLVANSLRDHIKQGDSVKIIDIKADPTAVSD